MSTHKYSFEVYTKMNCQACKAVKKWLFDRGVSFVEKDASEHLEMIRRANAGSQAPGVAFIVDGKQVLFWTGFRPSLMGELLSSTLAGQVKP